MSQKIKRKPVPGSLVVPGPSTLPDPPAYANSPGSMKSPQVWSASSTLGDPTFPSQHAGQADIRTWESDVKDGVDKESPVGERLGNLCLREHPHPPPSYVSLVSPSPSLLDIDERPAPTPIQSLVELDDNMPVNPTTPTRSKSDIIGDKFKFAYGEVRHFAGGLVTHPHESTKHYTIMRHSHSLIYYSGHYTSLAMSVFADGELPRDRSFWLQRRGYSGSAGLKIGTLMGSRSAWVDITPKVQATPDQLKPADERAYQRDIGRFQRKATKKTATHLPRETCILRIPCEAYDGYMRVVMCSGENGKKILCSSPIFRLFSTSAESSSIRGASLKTLPLEVAIKIGSTVANNAAKTAVTATAGPYVVAAKSVVGTQISKAFQMQGVVQKQVATAAFDKTAGVIASKMGELEIHADEVRVASYQQTGEDAAELMIEPVVIGDDAGPQKPYPIRFNGKVVAGTGKGTQTIGVPTADLTNVDSDISLRHTGVYFGWVAIHLPKKQQGTLLIDDDWHEAIIYIIPHADAKAGTVQKKTIKVHILQDFDDARFFDAKVSVIMMGFLRPVDISKHGDEEELAIKYANYLKDSACTTASLARPDWAADVTLVRTKSAASERTLTERYVDIRQSGQKSIDKVPLHRLGVRTDGHSLGDRLIGNGGVWIQRS